VLKHNLLGYALTAKGIQNVPLGVLSASEADACCLGDRRLLLGSTFVPETTFGSNSREENANERRRSSRFPIERELRYKTLSKRFETITGTGKTLNISSSGVLFSAHHDLALGTTIEVSISWPAQLNDRCLLNLVARGRVTRKEGGHLALQIQKYEFRTQAQRLITSKEATTISAISNTFAKSAT
jgi:PilZ domain